MGKADNILFNQLYSIAENCADYYYTNIIKAFTAIIKRQFANHQILLVNTTRALKFLKEYANRQVQLWQILQIYHDIPDQIADIHTHFDQLKSTLETDFKYLKEATAKNNHSLYTNLTLQQVYTSTLGSHIKNIYAKITELQNQIQHHCMYPHNTEHASSDTV